MGIYHVIDEATGRMTTRQPLALQSDSTGQGHDMQDTPVTI